MPTLPTPSGFPGHVTAFFDDLDDWCGTKVPRHFPPRPKSLRDVMLSVVLNEVADRVSDQKLQGQLKSLAVDLHMAGGRSLVG